jgi:hypothetical protein
MGGVRCTLAVEQACAVEVIDKRKENPVDLHGIWAKSLYLYDKKNKSVKGIDAKSSSLGNSAIHGVFVSSWCRLDVDRDQISFCSSRRCSLSRLMLWNLNA